jgi:hypothetical protein
LIDFVVKEDQLTLVEYKTSSELKTNEIPILSLCFNRPFKEHKLNEINSEINESFYKTYLSGDVFDSRLINVSYQDITFQLTDALRTVVVAGTGWSKTFDESRNKELMNGFIVNSFNGFVFGFHKFVKCFGIKMNDAIIEKAHYIILKFSPEKILEHMHPLHNILHLMVHYPNQTLIGSPFTQLMVIEDAKTWIDVRMRRMEIFQQSNRLNNCTEDWNSFDYLVAKQHILSNGCRPPYLYSNDLGPVCNTKEKMKISRYELLTASELYLPPPCKRMTNVDYDSHQIRSRFLKTDNYFSIKISIPGQVKIVTQVKAVDFGTFVSNVGGYIGLFLGTFYLL